MDALAEGSSAETPEPDTKWLEWPTLAQYEAHAKGERRFNVEELRLIEDHPRRLWMLAQAQGAYRPSLGERVIAAIRNLIGKVQPPSIPQLEYSHAAAVGTGAYPVVVEQPDGTVRADSEGVRATLAPRFTGDAYLVGQISLPDGVLKESAKLGYK